MSKKTHKARSQLPQAHDHVKGYPREHYNADHSPKMQYKTYKSARGVARHMFHKTGEILEPYQCPICGCWHLGHVKDIPLPEEVKTLKQKTETALTVLNGYRRDIEHKKNEIEAISTKIEKLEKLIWEQYNELTLYYKQKDEEQ